MTPQSCVIMNAGVLGHELVGRVEEVEENCTVTVGDRVVAEINLVCGKCHICKLASHQP